LVGVHCGVAHRDAWANATLLVPHGGVQLDEDDGTSINLETAEASVGHELQPGAPLPRLAAEGRQLVTELPYDGRSLRTELGSQCIQLGGQGFDFGRRQGGVCRRPPLLVPQAREEGAIPVFGEQGIESVPDLGGETAAAEIAELPALRISDPDVAHIVSSQGRARRRISTRSTAAL